MDGRFGCAESWTWVGQFASGVNGSSWLRLLVVPVNWEYCVGMVRQSGMAFVSPEDQPTWAILQFFLRGTQHHEASICLRKKNINFPLLVLRGICHYCEYVLIIFPGVLTKWKEGEPFARPIWKAQLEKYHVGKNDKFRGE